MSGNAAELDKLINADPDKKQDLTPRLIDLVSPIGKGQRSIIISPPKAGKTMIVATLTASIVKKYH